MRCVREIKALLRKVFGVLLSRNADMEVCGDEEDNRGKCWNKEGPLCRGREIIVMCCCECSSGEGRGRGEVVIPGIDPATLGWGTSSTDGRRPRCPSKFATTVRGLKCSKLRHRPSASSR